MLLYAMSIAAMTMSVMLMLVLIAVFVWIVKRRSERVGDSDVEHDTVDHYVVMHGQPEAAVVLDATRSNELDAVILVYDRQLVVGGEAISREAVTGVTFNNAANPYVNNNYQLVLTTTLPVRPVIRAALGSDAEWAKQVTTDLAQYIKLMNNE